MVSNSTVVVSGGGLDSGSTLYGYSVESVGGVALGMTVSNSTVFISSGGVALSVGSLRCRNLSEGRGWRGFHHHGTLSIVAYGFLVSERRGFPPQDRVPTLQSKNLPFPVITDPVAPPVRLQRHVPNSIATTRCMLVAAIAVILHQHLRDHRRFPRNLRRNL